MNTHINLENLQDGAHLGDQALDGLFWY